MADKLSCPYCEGSRLLLLEARYTVRIVSRPEGGPGKEKKCAVFRCFACGRTFDEVEAGEGSELEEDGEPSCD